MTQTEALKLALEALDGLSEPYDVLKAITAIREALAEQPEQEPVAWESLLGAIARGWCHEKNANKEMDADLAYAIATEIKALYTTPPAAPVQEPCQYAIDVAMPEHRCVGKCQYAAQRQWVGLTDEEIPEGVLLAIRRAGLTLVMTAQGYHLMNLGPIEAAHGIKE